MSRSTKEAWLTGPGDLREADVEDVPVPGQSVRVRGLSAKYSADVISQMQMVQEGSVQVARIDMAKMERLQFVHGCIDPSFSELEAGMIQERFGPAFKKVVAKIDELSGIDKEAIEATEQRFPGGGTRDDRELAVPDGVAAGNGGPDLPVSAG